MNYLSGMKGFPQKEKKTSSLQLKTRPPMGRIVAIHNILSANRYPNCSCLSRKFEVSSRTIQRDLDFMRYNLDLPIEYNSSQKGFYYSEYVPFLPTSDFTIKEVRALKAILDDFHNKLSPEIEEHIQSVITKMKKLNGLRDFIDAA